MRASSSGGGDLQLRHPDADQLHPVGQLGLRRRRISGGGIDNYGTATLTLTNSTLSGNSAAFSGGGGIFNSGTATVTLTNSTLTGNSAVSGGGIYNFGTATLTNSTLTGNSAGVDRRRRRIFNGGTATLTLTNSTLSGNSASYDGGGIFNGGTADADQLHPVGQLGHGYGGGIFNAARRR